VEASRSAALVFLASPHNPTGNEIEPAGIEAVARACPGIVALDEAYFEYSGTSGLGLLDRLDNLAILRTFSKAWGLAGFRLGYMVARPELIGPVSKARLPFSVGLLQQLAGVAALSMADRLRSSVGVTVEERERMYRILSRSAGFRVYPSRANFLLFECLAERAGEVSRRLAERGVAVRRFQDPRLDRALRVTVGTREENQAFLDALGVIPAGE
jgi:histidinol-phosphate aminotransferase